jgi:hypothetical protein
MMIVRLGKQANMFRRSTGRACQILIVCLLVVVLCAGCQNAAVQEPTKDQLLGRIMSADNYGVELIRGESTQLQGDMGILTASTGYLTPLTTSQLAGSIAGRFETMATIGIAAMPLNEKDPRFDAVDSKEVQAARLMADVCLACSQTPHGPVVSVQDIAERVAKSGKVAAQDSTYLQDLSRSLKKASDLIGRYINETDSSVRTTIAEQVTELCTQLKGQ